MTCTFEEYRNANPMYDLSAIRNNASRHVGQVRNPHYRAIVSEFQASRNENRENPLIPRVRMPESGVMSFAFSFIWEKKARAKRHRNIWKNRRLSNIRQERKFKQKMLNYLAEAA